MENQDDYETWCVKLWISNDEGLYIELMERISKLEDSEKASVVKDAITEMVMDNLINDVGLANDLINASLSRVNWDKVLELLEDI